MEWLCDVFISEEKKIKDGASSIVFNTIGQKLWCSLTLVTLLHCLDYSDPCQRLNFLRT